MSRARTAAVVLCLVCGLSSPAWAQPDAEGVGQGPPEEKGQPAKIQWEPSRLEIEDFGGGHTADVIFNSDKAVEQAEFWITGGLDAFLSFPAGLFAVAQRDNVTVTLTLLQTPDEAGLTLGGTLYVRELDGRPLAKPLVISLRRAGSGDGEDLEGTGPALTWEPQSLSPADLGAGPATVKLTANRAIAASSVEVSKKLG